MHGSNVNSACELNSEILTIIYIFFLFFLYTHFFCIMCFPSTHIFLDNVLCAVYVPRVYQTSAPTMKFKGLSLEETRENKVK
jgi:hypothetical protein